jgi:hypothetical protein
MKGPAWGVISYQYITSPTTWYLQIHWRHLEG